MAQIRALRSRKWQMLVVALFIAGASLALFNFAPKESGLAAPLLTTPTPAAQRSTSVTVPGQFTTSENEVLFEHLTIRDGLSKSSVTCIFQDHYGFMWFCTEDGLNRYDGYDFKVYRNNPKDKSSLSNSYVTSIYEDRAGGLWVGTLGGGLNYFDRDQDAFIHYRHDPEDPSSLSNDRVWSIYEDSQGFLWIGTNAGLNRLDRDTGQFIRYIPWHDDPFSLSHNVVRAIYEDHTGTLWVGTLGGLNRFDRTTEHFVPYLPNANNPASLAGSYVVAILEDNENTLWIATDGGLNKFNRQTDSFTSFQNVPDQPSGSRESYLRALYVDHTGMIWIGTYGGGLEKFNPETEQFIYYQNDPEDPYSLSNNYVWTIYEDRAGGVWVGTLNGISMFDRGREGFIHYRFDPDSANTLNDNRVWAIAEDRYGYLWVGTFNGGLNRLNRDTGKWDHYNYNPSYNFSLNSNTIRSIFEDRSGELWVGTENGLHRYDRAKNRFIRYRYDSGTAIGLGDEAIFTIFEDHIGNLWVGTLGGGLNRFDTDRNQLTHYQVSIEDGLDLSNSSILSIAEDDLGYLWIGTWGSGLSRLNPESGRFTTLRHNPDDPNSLSNNSVYSIHIDQQGILWLGTGGGGLNSYDPVNDVFTRYRVENGLPNDVVYGILEDDQGSLWLSTNNGLSRFDPVNKTFKNYDAGDGLQSNEFNAGAYFEASDGEMFFGGTSGLNAFYPRRVKDNPYVPPVVLTLMSQGGEMINEGQSFETLQEAVLTWPGNYFEFEFSALNYIRPDRNQYAYKLANFDKDWNYIGNRRFGRYTNLPGGNYTLLLKASNNDGVWNEEGIAIRVRVIPPFWETWWFQGSVVFLVVGLAIGGYQLRVRSIQARNLELQSLVTQRTSEIEQRRQVAEGLRDIVVILNSDRSLGEGLEYIVSQAARLTQAESVLIYQGQSMHPPSVCIGCGKIANNGSGPVDGYGEGGEWLVESLQTGDVLLATDLNEIAWPDQRPDGFLNGNYHSLMGIPVVVGAEVCGGLIFLYEHERTFAREDVQLASTFADQAGLAIANDRLRERAQQGAAESERNRLARDLHDSAKQQAFAALAQLGAAKGLLDFDTGAARDHLTESEELVYQVLQELSFLIHEMRTPILQEVGLEVALRNYVLEWAHKNGIETSFHMDDGRPMQPDIEYAVFRITQEALANIARHSLAHQAQVKITHSADEVSLEVRDNGCGFDLEHHHQGLGLDSMRERATIANGSFLIESAPGQGTRVCIRIPLQKNTVR